MKVRNGVCEPVSVAVEFVELASLDVAAHTMVALANWSHPPGETSGLRQHLFFSYFNNMVVTESCLFAGLSHITLTEAA